MPILKWMQSSKDLNLRSPQWSLWLKTDDRPDLPPMVARTEKNTADARTSGVMRAEEFRGPGRGAGKSFFGGIDQLVQMSAQRCGF